MQTTNTATNDSTHAVHTMEMHMANQRIDQANSTIIAANTLMQDTKIRKAWEQWCSQKGFQDTTTVHEAKMWLYVEDTLVKTNSDDGSLLPRLSKIKTKNKVHKPIGESVVRAHLAGLMKLYKEQAHILKINSNPMPDKEKISKFRKAMGNLKIRDTIKHNIDRGEGSLFDGYCTQEELNRLCQVAFEDCSLQSVRTRVIKY